jgi:hypothetical protein
MEPIMKTRRQIALVAVVLLAAPLRAAALQSPADQFSIAAQLLSEDRNERNKAFELARTIQPEDVSPRLRAALIALLTKENEIVREAARRDEPLAYFDDPEFIASLSRFVGELRDPRAIPALSEAIYGGVTVMRALAAFGEPAVAPVVKVVSSSESHYNAVNHGLITLRLIVEGTPAQPLSKASLEQIRGAVEQRLTGKQYFTILWQAIDLAVVLDDARLRGIVETLATDWNVVLLRGVEDPELIERTRQRATERLAGVPPLPRPKDLLKRAPE